MAPACTPGGGRRTPSSVLGSGRLQHPVGLRQRLEEPFRRRTPGERQLEAVAQVLARRDPCPVTEVIEQDDAGPGQRVDLDVLRTGVDSQGRLDPFVTLDTQLAHLAVAGPNELLQILNIGVTRDDVRQCPILLCCSYIVSYYVARLN